MTHSNNKIKSIVTDIRVWILLLFIVRLIGITNPPADVSHNWRQSTVNMVARNYLEGNHNILYPTLDFGGDRTGIAPMEAPLFNYSIYLVSEVFGFKHWYGRLINLIFSSIGIWYFFKLIRLKFNEKTAFYASLVLLFSIWFTFSRKIMPDTIACSFMFIGIYHGVQFFTRNKKVKDICLYGLCILVGVAVKLPVGFYLFLMIPIVLKHIVNWKSILVFIFISLLAISPSYFWYFIWNPHLSETYHFNHFFLGKGMSQGFIELTDLPQLTSSRFYDTALKYSGFILFLSGVFFTIIKKQYKILITLIIGIIGFSIIMLKSGTTFSHHSYYVIPFVPFMALVAGYSLELIKKPWLLAICLLAFITESSLNHQDDFRIRDRFLPITELEQKIDKVIPKNAKIGINCSPNPTPMYFAHRKGWLLKKKHLSDSILNKRKEGGMKYIIHLKKEFKTFDISANLGEVIYSDESIDIIQL